MKRLLKISLIVIASLLVILLAALHIATREVVVTELVDKYAPEYIDAHLSIGSVKTSVIKSFPYLNVSLDTLSLTYPHDRFSSYESVAEDAPGRGLSADTLLSVNNVSVSVNYLQAIKGEIRLSRVSAKDIHLYAFQYDSSAANWNVFKTEPAEDSSSFEMPKIILKQASLTGKNHISYFSPSDSLKADMTASRILFGGHIDLSSQGHQRLFFDLENLAARAKYASDSAAFEVKRIRVREKRDVVAVNAIARAFLSLDGTGEVSLPLELQGDFKFPEDNFNSLDISNLRARMAMLNLKGDFFLKMEPDSIYLKADAQVKQLIVKDVLELAANFVPEAKKLETDAQLSFSAVCDGYFVPSEMRLPPFSVDCKVPRSTIRWTDWEDKGVFKGSFAAKMEEDGKLDVKAQDVDLDYLGLCFMGNASVTDLMGQDPLFDLKLDVKAELDTLSRFLPKGYRAKGQSSANLKGKAYLSQLSAFQIGNSSLEGEVQCDNVSLKGAGDSLLVFLKNTNLKLGKLEKSEIKEVDKGITGKADSLFFEMGNSIHLRGRKLGLNLQNSLKSESEEYGAEVYTIIGNLNAQSLAFAGSDSLLIALRNTKNRFKLSAQPQGDSIEPILAFTTVNEGIFARHPSARAGLRNASFSVSAIHTNPEARRKELRAHILAANPSDTLRPALFRREVKKDDFSERDFDFKLSEQLGKYFREWRVNGSMNVAGGFFGSPHFPLRNRILGLSGHFTNNDVVLDSLVLNCGKSDIKAVGKISGLRRALLRNGVIQADLDLSSGFLDAKELLLAYQKGLEFLPAERSEDIIDDTISDEDYLRSVVNDSIDNQELRKLLVIVPANIDFTMNISGKHIVWSDLDVSSFSSRINMKDRCMQLTDTRAESNLGDISLEGFYSTKSKQDISAGFDLIMEDVTADRVVALFPAIDSVIPLLKSFKGVLDCGIAATSALDTNMSFIPSSIQGALNISGSNLVLEKNEAIEGLAKTLMLKDNKVGNIDDMSVQGIIADNQLEVFPFVLKIKKYTVAMSGLQYFDQSFKYHMSVLESPVPFRFGLDLKGNFDNWKYSIVKAKYKNASVPVFTAQIDQMRLNLVDAIHNVYVRGVETAIADNASALVSVQDFTAKAGFDASGSSSSLSAVEQAAINMLFGHEKEEPKAAAVAEKVDSSSVAENAAALQGPAA